MISEIEFDSFIEANFGLTVFVMALYSQVCFN